MKLTRNSFQTFNEYFHVAFASCFVQIEISAGTFHLIPTIGEWLVDRILWQCIGIGLMTISGRWSRCTVIAKTNRNKILFQFNQIKNEFFWNLIESSFGICVYARVWPWPWKILKRQNSHLLIAWCIGMHLYGFRIYE